MFSIFKKTFFDLKIQLLWYLDAEVFINILRSIFVLFFKVSFEEFFDLKVTDKTFEKNSLKLSISR